MEHGCYNKLRNLTDAGRETWATKVKKIVFNLGFGVSCIWHAAGHVTAFMSEAKQRLFEMAEKNGTHRSMNWENFTLCHGLSHGWILNCILELLTLVLTKNYWLESDVLLMTFPLKLADMSILILHIVNIVKKWRVCC